MLDPLITTLVILVIATLLFMSDRISPDLVALLVSVSLGVTGVLTPQEAFSGFSRSAVITLLAIFILAEGIRRSGFAEQVGRLLVRLAGPKEGSLVLTVMLAGAFLSLFMNNIAAAAVLLPAVTGAARRLQVRLSRLMMPLAFATILGGMATLFTTTNIVASGLLRDANLEGYGVLDFAPLGFPIVLAGILFMVLIGRRLLPKGVAEPIRRAELDLVGVYRLGERLVRARILPESPLAGMTLSQSHLREAYGLSVVALEHAGQVNLTLSPLVKIAAGDVLTLEGRTDLVPWETLKDSLEVLPARAWGERDLESPQVAVVEAVLSPRSRLIGQTLKEVGFREKYGMVVLAIWRNGRPRRRDLVNLTLEFGDALLLQGPRSRIKVLSTDPDVILLNEEEEPVPLAPRQSRIAVTILGISLVASIVFQNNIAEILLAGGLFMVIFKLLTMEQSYRAIEWKTVFLIAGMLPMGLAITKSGVGEWTARGVISVLGNSSPLVILAGLFILTMLLAQVMHSGAAATLMVPITIQIANQLSIDPRSLVMGVTLATSMAFITPLGHPVNILVMGPAGYTFKDFFKVGLPLTILLFIIVLVLLPLIWPFK